VKLFWIRQPERFYYNTPKVYYSEGVRGSGKSTLIEHLAMRHLAKGSALLDCFGSVDGEGISWLRAPFTKNLNVCLLQGDNVDISSSYTTRKIEQLGLHDLEKFDLLISARPFYVNRDAEYYAIGQLTELLYRRLHWRRMLTLICREASNLWFSRLMMSQKQSDIKSESIYMLRESRHLGVSLCLDSLRALSIDKDCRVLIDYLFIKAVGVEGLSEDMKFLYSFYPPAWLRSMKPWQFILLCRTGGLAAGHFPFHTWHKREREDIVSLCGLKINYGEVLLEGANKGTFKNVGDKEHSEIVALYCEQGMGMQTIAKEKGRSTRTIDQHIISHNAAVKRSGFCGPCKRTGSKHYNVEAVRSKRKIEDPIQEAA
jgi:hypothetical protein